MSPPASAVASPRQDRAAAARPAAAPSRRPALEVVGDPQRRHRRRRRMAPVLSLALLMGSLLAVVVGHAVLAEGQVRLSSVEAELAAAQATNHQATLSVAALETPSRIVSDARQTLHMTQPSQIVELPHVPLGTPLATPDVKPAPPVTTVPAQSATTPPTAAGQ